MAALQPHLPIWARVPKDAPGMSAAAAAVTGTAAPDAAIVGIQTVPNPDPTAALEVALPNIVILPTTSTSPSPQPTSAAGDKPQDGDDNDTGECQLLGPFAIFVQLGLGALALLSLVYKRWRERPQRPMKIWFFDVSKQVFGSVLVHVANVFMSMLTSGRLSIRVSPEVVATTGARLLRRVVGGDGGEEYVPNPCSFYLLNLAIDTTLGIPILIFLLRTTTALASYTRFGQPPESIQSGHYGHPPSAWWWLKQSVIYFCGLFGMKVCVLIIFLALPWISRVGDWALGWTEGNEKLQIVFVMMLFPLIMNALQYYIIDSFIKERSQAGGAEESATGRYDRVADEEADEEEGSDGSELDEVGGTRAAKKDLEDEYDPAVDGDSRTVASSSSGNAPKAKVPKELYPHE